MKNIRSMSMQLLRLIMLAGTCSILLLTGIHLCSNLLIKKSFPGSKLQLLMTEKRIEKFRDYITKNSLSATDSEDLIQWCNEQPMILMEIYRGDILCFNSYYSYANPLVEQNIKKPRYSWYSYYELLFADGPADVLVYSDESYVLNTWITIGSIILSGTLFITIILIGIRKTIRYIYLLCDEIQIMANGDLEHPISVKGQNELGMLAKELDQMRSMLYYHHQKEQDIIKQNNDMITGLSHDLRTPLTKLMLYAEIIHNDKCTDKQQLIKYLDRIHEKSLQMKEISEHLLKYSLSHRMGETAIAQKTSFHTAFFDRLSELTDYLLEYGFVVECDIDWKIIQICYNDFCLDRILDNIVSNIEKYADKTYPVLIRSVESDNSAGISIKNTLSPFYDEAESSGVGIENIRTMMQRMNGKCSVNYTKTEFEILILFPK